MPRTDRRLSACEEPLKKGTTMSSAPARHTKIVCTLGPASRSPQVLRELLLAGMDVARLNFSHDTPEGHAAAIRTLRAQAKALGREVAIFADLQGPKIRTNCFPGGAIHLERGARVSVVHSEKDGAPGLITTRYFPLVRDAVAGDRLLLNDGFIELRVVAREGEGLTCEVVNGGELKDRRGINLPGVKLDVPAMTEKDLSDARFALAHDVDFIALSFVRSARDVEQLKAVIAEQPRRVQVIAKIEKPEALDELDAILKVTDAVMVARGDLGVELGIEKVPAAQKQVIRQALCHGVPVITATQMLESMVVSARPTRAEVSDVANAVFDGTDALMLSGETSAGAYPVETVRIMGEIIDAAERQQVFFNFDDWHILDSSSSALGMSLGKAARLFAEQTGAKAMSCLSDTGNAAIRLTAQRPQIPVYMFSRHTDSVRRMGLVRGARGILLEEPLPPGRVFPGMESILLERGCVQRGDVVVYTAGISQNRNVSTNTIHIRTAGEDAAS
ncbi:MAG: pyruvate kinase [Deltaproteobacteria bacterium]|nr:pyruvate kinase [Deltaproteobacteria bacterium]